MDKWLLQSKNACPCCRTVAVKTRSDSSEGVSDPQDEREPLEQLASAMQSESLA